MMLKYYTERLLLNFVMDNKILICNSWFTTVDIHVRNMEFLYASCSKKRPTSQVYYVGEN